jgi:dipeptidyl aminopeptidase/acylaminoacyl peptidase
VIPDVVTKESGAADYAVSASGTLVYLPGGLANNSQALAWREPDGRDTPLPRVPAQNYQTLRVSPEGQRALALVSPRQGAPASLWLIDLVRETTIRLTTPELPVNAAVWHPDGKQIVFTTWSTTVPVEARGLFRISVSGTGAPEPLLSSQLALIPMSWTPNGSHLIVTSGPGTGNADIGHIALATPSEVTPLIAGPAPESAPALSPNGRWLAYVLNDNGVQLFVRPYPDVDAARIPASNGFGMNPVWSRDGRQLYFSALNNELHVMDVEETATTIAFGKPRLVMLTRDELNDQIRLALPPVNGRILRTVRATSGLERPTEYRVVLNWTEELKARVARR